MKTRLAVALLALALTACGQQTSSFSGGTDPTDGPGPGNGAPPDPEFDRFLDDAITDIDAFWASNFGDLSSTSAYTSPMRVTAYAPGTLPAGAGCGLAEEDPNRWINNAFHCADGHLIAYDDQFLHELYVTGGEFAPVAILAHEWGHHVASLAGSPAISMQRELQADCYAGVYASNADDRGRLGTSELRDVVVNFFNQGDANYQEESWFGRGVHGPPYERALAAGSGILTEDVAYCANYGGYQPRDALSLGTYSLYVPAALEWQSVENGLTKIIGPHADAYVAFRSDLGTGDAISLARGVAQDWFGAGWEALEEPHAAGVAAVFGGTDAVHAYEWSFQDSAGNARVQHGAMLLLASGDGDGLIIDVAQVGPAPPLSAETMQAIGDFLYLLAWGVCPPSGLSWACETT